MATRGQDEHILQALTMLRNGRKPHWISARLGVDPSNLLVKMRKIRDADAECGEDMSGHYGVLR